MKSLVLGILLFIITPFSFAQLNHGDEMPNLELWNPANNKALGISNEKTETILVLIYFDHECPYSKIYTERIIKIAKNYYDQNVSFILIHPRTNSNDIDLQHKMNVYAEKNNFPFPYVFEKVHILKNELNVEKTPSCYVYKNINHKFIMQYNGAIDDTPTNNKQVNEHYLTNAINALLSNKGMKRRQTHVVGSDIVD